MLSSSPCPTRPRLCPPPALSLDVLMETTATARDAGIHLAMTCALHIEALAGDRDHRALPGEIGPGRPGAVDDGQLRRGQHPRPPAPPTPSARIPHTPQAQTPQELDDTVRLGPEEANEPLITAMHEHEHEHPGPRARAGPPCPCPPPIPGRTRQDHHRDHHHRVRRPVPGR